MKLKITKSSFITTLGAICVAASAQAQLPNEEIGSTTLPFPPDAHRSYVVDSEFESMVSGRVYVIDPDKQKVLGMVSTAGMPPIALSNDKKTIYVADTYHTRYTRGKRTDTVTAWDTSTLSPTWEVEVPTKRAMSITQRHALGTSSDDKFVYVYNFTPATSISVVDTQKKIFLNEINIEGCYLSYPVKEREIASICGNGSLQLIKLDDLGNEIQRSQTPFFDPDAEKVVERAILTNNILRFVSTTGTVHSIDLSQNKPKVLPTWSLVNAAQKAEGWAPGGWDLIAVSPALNRLYVLMHPDGKPLNWEDPSTIIWEYDLASQKKTAELNSPNHIWSLHATGDESPLLLGTNIEGGVEIFDLMTRQHAGTMEGLAKAPIQIKSH